MKIKMLVNTGGYDEGEVYDLPDDIAKAMIKDKAAEKA